MTFQLMDPPHIIPQGIAARTTSSQYPKLFCWPKFILLWWFSTQGSWHNHHNHHYYHHHNTQHDCGTGWKAKARARCPPSTGQHQTISQTAWTIHCVTSRDRQTGCRFVSKMSWLQWHTSSSSPGNSLRKGPISWCVHSMPGLSFCFPETRKRRIRVIPRRYSYFDIVVGRQ